MTRLGDLLYIGQLFKACGNNYFFTIFVKAPKTFILLEKSFLGNWLLVNVLPYHVPGYDSLSERPFSVFRLGDLIPFGQVLSARDDTL